LPHWLCFENVVDALLHPTCFAGDSGEAVKYSASVKSGKGGVSAPVGEQMARFKELVEAAGQALVAQVKAQVGRWEKTGAIYYSDGDLKEESTNLNEALLSFPATLLEMVQTFADNLEKGVSTAVAGMALEANVGLLFHPGAIVNVIGCTFLLSVLEKALVHSPPGSVSGSGSKIHSRAGLACIFALRAGEKYGPPGGLEKGPDHVDPCFQANFRVRVFSALLQLTRPIEDMFAVSMEAMKAQPRLYTELLEVASMSSAAPGEKLSQCGPVMREGGPGYWYRVAQGGEGFKWYDEPSSSSRGFPEMVASAEELELEYVDHYGMSEGSPCSKEGTWAGLASDKGGGCLWLDIYNFFQHAYSLKHVQPHFQTAIKNVLKDVNVELKLGQHKSLQRSSEKADTLPKSNDTPPAALILDLNRCMVLVNDLRTLVDTAHAIMADPVFDVEGGGRIKNRYELATPTSGGYRDLMICPLFDGKMVVEIQLCYRPFSEIKLLSHSFYVLFRTMSEYCNEDMHGKRGRLTQAQATAHFDGLLTIEHVADSK
jgi:hypothetical protein